MTILFKQLGYIFQQSGYIFHGSSHFSFLFFINVPILQVSKNFNNEHFR